MKNLYFWPFFLEGGKIVKLKVLLFVPVLFSVLTAIAGSDIQFSHKRGFYFQTFELTITSNSGAEIYYSLDCSEPDKQTGVRYTGVIQIDSTLVVKASTFKNNELIETVSHTFIFPEVSARQNNNPNGFPEKWGGARIINADYEMDSAVVYHPDYAELISEAFTSLPAISLSMGVDEWFNHQTGLYVGYENSDITREKPVAAEFIFNNASEESFEISCGIQNQGGTSIVKWKSPKQSMRLLFKSEYGPGKLERKFFPDSEINSINTLVLDAMLNATWIHPTDEKQRTNALYLRDQLTSDIYNNMDRLSFHGRYFNLFINGIFWGIYNIHERPDDAFLSEYYESDRLNFDVLKHNPENVVSGSNGFYQTMLQVARNGFADNPGFENFKRYVDIPAFIDYMILNFYLGNFDWAHQNYYVARDRISSVGFRYYPWDSEHVMRFAEVDYDNTQKNNEGGPTEIHTLLKENEEYRIMFADAVYRHCFNNGALTPENIEKAFLKRVNEIEKAIILESARWGDYRIGVSNTTYTKNENWLKKVDEMLTTYIPLRKDIFIEQLRNSKNLLFPEVLPPSVLVNELPGGKKEITLSTSFQGDIYYTLDGTDPRGVGGIPAGIKYNDKLVLEKTSLLKTRFFSSVYGWSPILERKFIFDDVYGNDLIITEIMYHPVDEYPEFIEVVNYGENTINLNGFSFADGIDFTFNQNAELLPGAGFVLTNDNVLFNQVYGFSSWGQYNKKLSNNGETIILKNGFSQVVDSVNYSDTIPWPVEADGDGFSLELIDFKLDNSLHSSWKASNEKYGSPFNENEKVELEMALSPNPFSDKTSLKILSPGYKSDNFLVEVFSITGNKVTSGEMRNYTSELSLDLGEAPPGIYIIRIFQKNAMDIKPVVIKGLKIN